MRHGGDFGFSKEFRKIDGACGQDTHSQYTSVQYSLFTSAERTDNALGSSIGMVIFVRQDKCCYLVWPMSHPWLPHLPFTMSTSSSSPMYPTTHREHSVHPAHLQAPSVDKLRHQNHSVVKTCRVAETRAPQLPHWKDIKMHKSKYVYAVFSFGSETWSWTQQTLGKKTRIGNKNIDENIRRDVGRVPDKNQHYGHEDIWADDVAPFFYEKNCGKHVARHGMVVRRKNECSSRLPEERVQVEKFDERRSRKQHINGDGTIVDMCGIRRPRVGQVRKTG